MVSETGIILAIIISFFLVVWIIYQYNKSNIRKPRNPHEEMAYQEEIARQQAREDFRKNKFDQLREDKWRKNLGKNIERSWRF